ENDELELESGLNIVTGGGGALDLSLQNAAGHYFGLRPGVVRHHDRGIWLEWIRADRGRIVGDRFTAIRSRDQDGFAAIPFRQDVCENGVVSTCQQFRAAQP